MDFIDYIRQFSSRVQGLLTQIQDEQTTKQALILPFLQLLGYNVFDPFEVKPEFTADVGIKKGEKVDYAILKDGKPTLLIEAKPVTDDLSAHDGQLFRYFSVSDAKFAILTNGVIYRFYSDLHEPNKMDEEPFFVFNLLEPDEAAVAEVKRFHKETFNPDDLSSIANNLMYTTRVRTVVDREFSDPSDGFLKYILHDIYDGKVTQAVLDRFRPLVKKALSQYITDSINERLKTVIKSSVEDAKASEPVDVQGTDTAMNAETDAKPQAETTQEELEAFFAIKAILSETIDPKRIAFKDNVNWLTIFIDGSIRRWICRLFFNRAKKYLVLPGIGGGEQTQIPVETVDDLFKLKPQLLEVVSAMVAPKAAS